LVNWLEDGGWKVGTAVGTDRWAVPETQAFRNLAAIQPALSAVAERYRK